MSKPINIKKIHAFADGNYMGNPAGYVKLDSELLTEEMQRLATELEGFVSEVVYLKECDNNADYELRYFSCEREVPFCGHGTLAVINHEVMNNPALLEKDTIRIRTLKGILDIENHFKELGTVFIYAPEKENIPSDIALDLLACALNIAPEMIDRNRPVEIFNAGQNTLIVPLNSMSAVIECAPDYQTIRDFCFENNCEVVNIFSSEVEKESSSYRSRIFAPTFGYLEDPATGSGNCALAYYLEDNILWDGSDLIIEQGKSRQTPNIVYIRKPSGNKKGVMFGGKTITRLEGTYYL